MEVFISKQSQLKISKWWSTLPKRKYDIAYLEWVHIYKTLEGLSLVTSFPQRKDSHKSPSSVPAAGRSYDVALTWPSVEIPESCLSSQSEDLCVLNSKTGKNKLKSIKNINNNDIKITQQTNSHLRVGYLNW